MNTTLLNLIWIALGGLALYYLLRLASRYLSNGLNRALSGVLTLGLILEAIVFAAINLSGGFSITTTILTVALWLSTFGYIRRTHQSSNSGDRN